VVHELEVEVGLGGVAGVAALGQRLAGGHPVAGPDPDRAPAQVGQGGVDPAAQVEDQVVAEDPAGPQQLADHALDEQVAHGRRRGAAPVVALAVMGPDHGARGRGHDRPAEPGEVVRPPGQGPPGQPRAWPVGGVVDQVDGVGLAVGVQVVAGHPAARAVVGQPPARHRHGHLDRRPAHRPQAQVHGEGHGHEGQHRPAGQVPEEAVDRDGGHPEVDQRHPQARQQHGHRRSSLRRVTNLLSLCAILA
jgi:hypothetical protein